MDLIVVGTVALDDIRTPFGDEKNLPGGSATHFSIAASHLVQVGIVGVIGEDLPEAHLNLLSERNIDLAGIEKQQGKSFHWKGFYEYDMNSAHTLDTQLGVLATFDPKLPAAYRSVPYVFLANSDPDIQMRVLDQLDRPKFTFLDSMNFWISSKKGSLEKVIRRVNGVVFNEEEARQFCNTPNLITAGNRLLDLGPSFVIIKKGEHGSLLFSRDFSFAAVAYPTEKIIDPTGAGDSFAGGFMSYIARHDRLDEDVFREAVNFGSVMASFMVEDFSYRKLVSITTMDLLERYNRLYQYIHFEPLDAL